MTETDKNTLHYQENSIASARPEELTLMMYNGLLKFIARAQEEIRARQLEAAHNTLLRCQDIVFEFQYTLNMDYAVSNNLMLLYDYLYNRLIEANAKKDCAILDEVYGFVAELRDTWAEAVKANREHKPEASDSAGAGANTNAGTGVNASATVSASATANASAAVNASAAAQPQTATAANRYGETGVSAVSAASGDSHDGSAAQDARSFEAAAKAAHNLFGADTAAAKTTPEAAAGTAGASEAAETPAAEPAAAVAAKTSFATGAANAANAVNVANPVNTVNPTNPQPPVNAPNPPNASRGKMIYKRSGMPLEFASANNKPANAQPVAPNAGQPSAAFNVAQPSAASAPSTQPSAIQPPVALNVTQPFAASAPDGPINRKNFSAAAQYAKVSKSKTPPRENISIASE